MPKHFADNSLVRITFKNYSIFRRLGNMHSVQYLL
ncbi:hypothetical protein EVA_06146 [gut metagenome]|uniref:Uncharacterized protein n=1 Tax=gut metagenome TaxID=749906 RepID=J9CZN6_9ZZZZ